MIGFQADRAANGVPVGIAFSGALKAPSKYILLEKRSESSIGNA